MPQILDDLQVDHRNMRQLLRILDEELQAYDTRGSADFDLMKQIMEYTLHYPSLIHHPREECCFGGFWNEIRHPKGWLAISRKNMRNWRA